jgi:hypothetical protein
MGTAEKESAAQLAHATEDEKSGEEEVKQGDRAMEGDLGD